MKVAKSKCNLDCVETCVVLWETSDLTQVHEKLSSSYKTHHKEDLLISLEHVTHSYKERMISFEQNVLFQFG